jgi:hypothetical protein
MAYPIKRKFHAKRSTTEKAALARFRQLFKEEIEQCAIQNMYNWYPKDYMIVGGLEAK